MCGASCRSLLRFCSGFRSLPAPNVTFRPGIAIHQPLRNHATTARPGNSPGSFGRQERAGDGRDLFCSAQRSLHACLSHVHAESIPRLHREVHDRPHRLPRRQLKFEIPRQRRQNQSRLPHRRGCAQAHPRPDAKRQKSETIDYACRVRQKARGVEHIGIASQQAVPMQRVGAIMTIVPRSIVCPTSFCPSCCCAGDGNGSTWFPVRRK